MTTICFVCLKQISKRSSGGSKGDHDDYHLFNGFSNFANEFLGISFDDREEPQLNYGGERKLDKEEDHFGGGKGTFCEDCGTVVGSIYELYQELLAVQLRLSSKLGELGKLMEKSEEDVSYKMGRMLINSLEKQLGFKKPGRVDRLRGLLKLKCMEKQRETSPQGRVQRDVKVEVDAETNSRISMDLYDDDDDSVPFENYDNFESLLTEPEEERKKDDTTTTGGRIGGADEGGEEEIFIKEEPLDEDEQETNVHLNYQPDEDEEGDNDEEGSYYEPSSCSELESDCDSYSKLEEDSSPVQKSGVKSSSLTEKAPEPKDFPCLTCSKSFSTKESLSKHSKEVHTSRRFQCSHCTTCLKSKRTLEDHYIAVHNPESHPCPHSTCSKTFRTKKLLRDHMGQVHVDPSSRRHPCPKPNCSKSYFKRADLKKHILKKHGPSSLAILETHEKLREAQKEECSSCKRKFPDSKRLISHFHLTHEPTLCESCGKTFEGSARKRKHFSEVHGGEKHLCPTCGKEYSSVIKLSNHIESFHDQKQHFCSDCNLPFKSKVTLKTHMIAKHNPESHNCLQCGKHFKIVKYLRSHERKMHPKSPQKRDPKCKVKCQ